MKRPNLLLPLLTGIALGAVMLGLRIHQPIFYAAPAAVLEASPQPALMVQGRTAIDIFESASPGVVRETTVTPSHNMLREAR